MQQTTFQNRRAVQLENGSSRVTVLVEGGHIAEILDKRTGLNPLWNPPWPSIEPSAYSQQQHPEYGNDAESKLLAGIMGHNLCMDIFGDPSTEEAKAGLTVHGEAPVVPYSFRDENGELAQIAELHAARLRLVRRIRLLPPGGATVVRIHETVENITAADHPVAWTQHVTLGPPFLQPGKTQFRAPATRSKVYEVDFGGDKGLMKTGAEFDWPNVPLKDGRAQDLRTYTNAPSSGGLTTHLLDPHREQAFFVAYAPEAHLLFGYIWCRSDFPWLAIWEENRSRTGPPWNGQTVTRGMEFGVSPFPETRRRMVERRELFGTPSFRWIPARSTVTVEYFAFLKAAREIPEEVSWNNGNLEA